MYRHWQDMSKQLPINTKDDAVNARNERLRQHLLPDFPVGCSRVLIGFDFLRSFTKSHVDLIPGSLKSIGTDSVVVQVDRPVTLSGCLVVAFNTMSCCCHLYCTAA